MQRLFLATVMAGMLSGVWMERQSLVNAATPPATSYAGVEKNIASIRQGWSRPGAVKDPNARGWNVLFDSLLGDLNEYSKAENSTARLTPLNRIYEVSNALAAVPWSPAASLREELRQWLRPRIRLAWAERRLDETVRKTSALK